MLFRSLTETDLQNTIILIKNKFNDLKNNKIVPFFVVHVQNGKVYGFDLNKLDKKTQKELIYSSFLNKLSPEHLRTGFSSNKYIKNLINILDFNKIKGYFVIKPQDYHFLEIFLNKN